jgi:hypothetical protein
LGTNTLTIDYRRLIRADFSKKRLYTDKNQGGHTVMNKLKQSKPNKRRRQKKKKRNKALPLAVTISELLPESTVKELKAIANRKRKNRD